MALADPTVTSRDVADLVRRFYEALAARDMPAMGAFFTVDALWHLPGTSSISGDHVGWPAIRDEVMAKLGPLSGGTFRAELIDVAVGKDYVVAIQHATAQFGGKSLDITGCQLIRLQDGLIAEVRGHYSDEAALDAFWA